MALLDGFKVIPLTEKIEDSYLTVTSKSLKFNRATARVLGVPEKVLILANDKKIQIAITPANEDDEDGIDFTFEEGGKEKPIYVKEPMILKEICRLATLEKNGQNLALTMKGLVYPDEKVIIYDLVEAEAVPIKPRGRKSKSKD